MAHHKRTPAAHTSYITPVEDDALKLREKHSASAEVETANDATCSGRGVPFRRGRFQPLSLVTQCHGPRGRGRAGGKNEKWDWACVKPWDLQPFNLCSLPALRSSRLSFIMKQSHQH